MHLLFFLILIIILCIKRFLLILVCIEFLLILILHSYLSVIRLINNDWIFLIILIIGVCERVIGLRLLIGIIFLYGNQSVKILRLIW